MGAAVAWSMLERHGLARIAGLVVVDMSPRPLNDAGWRLGLRDGLDLARSDRCGNGDAGRLAGLHRAHRAFAVPARPAAGRDARRLGASEVAGCDPSAMATMWRSLVAQDFRALVPQIACPTLLVYGVRSRALPPGRRSPGMADQSPRPASSASTVRATLRIWTEAAAFNDVRQFNGLSPALSLESEHERERPRISQSSIRLATAGQHSAASRRRPALVGAHLASRSPRPRR